MDYYFDAKNVCVLLEDLNATQRERQDSASMFKGRKSRRPFFIRAASMYFFFGGKVEERHEYTWAEIPLTSLILGPKNIVVEDYEYNNKKMGRSLVICATF